MRLGADEPGGPRLPAAMRELMSGSREPGPTQDPSMLQEWLVPNASLTVLTLFILWALLLLAAMELLRTRTC